MQEQNTNQEETSIKLDFTLDTPERLALVNKIIEAGPPEKLTRKYLDILASYLVVPITKEEKKERKILTENRKKHIKERETSFEGLTATFNNHFKDFANENAEDAIYNLISDNKNILLTPKIKRISEEDIAEVPGLRDLVDEINRLEDRLKVAKGRERLTLKNNIIELRKDQYALRASYRGPIRLTNITKSISRLDLFEDITVTKDGDLIINETNISLLVPEHVEIILCNYSRLKEETATKFESDIYYTLIALEELVDKALADFPLYYDLLVYKIDGMKNADIQRELELTFGMRYSLEHISSLWRNKIPKLIAECAQEQYLNWYYTEKVKGNWKKCSRCGQIKLAHPRYFSKNKTSKDGFYSICKDCRSNKVGKVKEL